MLIDNPGRLFIEDLMGGTCMTVAVIHDNPFIDKYFNDIGALTVDLSKRDTTLDFTYFAQPQIEVVSSLKTPWFRLQCNCIRSIRTQNFSHQIKRTICGDRFISRWWSLLHRYSKFQIINGLQGFQKLINGFGDMTIDTTMGGGILNYEFIKLASPTHHHPSSNAPNHIAQLWKNNKLEFTTQEL